MPTARNKMPRDPADVLQSISTKASNVKDAAAALTERIQKFEAYLSTVRGRVETECYGHHPDATFATAENLMSLALLLHKKGKSWVLSWGTHRIDYEDQDPDYTVDWKPLVEAPLKIKVAAVKMFPDLLEAIEKSQDKLVEEVEGATDFFDTFEETLPKTEGK